MSLILQTMISAGSLAAFTAAAPQAQQLRPGSGIRTTTAQTAAPGNGAAPTQAPPQPGSASPARSLPRGSLLDLAV